MYSSRFPSFRRACPLLPPALSGFSTLKLKKTDAQEFRPSFALDFFLAPRSRSTASATLSSAPCPPSARKRSMQLRERRSFRRLRLWTTRLILVWCGAIRRRLRSRTRTRSSLPLALRRRLFTADFRREKSKGCRTSLLSHPSTNAPSRVS